LHEEQVERERKRAWSWSNPWREILEHVGAYLEHIGAEDEIEESRLSGLKSELLVSCTKTTSVCCWFVGSFPSSESSLEFPAERFLVTCARETPVNEWDA
jgi:hypothetical protein